MKIPDYRPDQPTEPLDDEALDELDRQLAELPGDEVMNVEMLDGYLTALLVAPIPPSRLRGEDWMPPVWGGDGPGRALGPFGSSRQRKRVVVGVLRRLHALDQDLRGEAETWEPVFSIAEAPDGTEWVDAEDWCIGFLRGCALDPDGWSRVFDDPAFAELLQPIVQLGADSDGPTAAPPPAGDDTAARDQASRRVPEAVLALHRRPR